jgi:hypothetical protein
VIGKNVLRRLKRKFVRKYSGYRPSLGEKILQSLCLYLLTTELTIVCSWLAVHSSFMSAVIEHQEQFGMQNYSERVCKMRGLQNGAHISTLFKFTVFFFAIAFRSEYAASLPSSFSF